MVGFAVVTGPSWYAAALDAVEGQPLSSTTAFPSR